MAYDTAGYRDHCGECCHLVLDKERTKYNREIFGEHMPKVYYCEKLHIRVELLDSPNNSSSKAAGCYGYEKASYIRRYSS